MIASHDIKSISKEVSGYLEKQKILLASRMTVVLTFAFAILTTAYIYDTLGTFLLMGLVLLISIFCLFMMYYRKNYKLVFFAYSTTGVLIISASLFILPSANHLVDFVWLLACISLAYFGIGKKVGILFFIVIAIIIVVFIFYALNTHIESIKVQNLFQKFALITEVIAAFLLNFYLLFLFINFNIYSKEVLKEANIKLIQQNSKIKLQNDEKSLLLKEINHRVKDNLQIIATLLRLQNTDIDKNHEVRLKIDESIQRIMVMSMVHEKLYQNNNLSKVKFVEYANELIASILKATVEKKEIQFSVHSDIKEIGQKSLIPIGLILNELVSNSLKYAFLNKNEGFIELEVLDGEKGNWIKLIYKDNGVWNEFQTNSGFGLQLIHSLVEQLDGSIDILKNANGTTFKMEVFNDMEVEIHL